MRETDAMGIYEKLRRRLNNLSDTLYFSLGKRLRKSILASPENIITFIILVVVVFLLSGGLVALASPAYIAQVFTRTTTSQTAGETILFFFLNLIAFASLYLVEKGVTKRRLDPISFLTGLILFFMISVVVWYIVSTFKGG